METNATLHTKNEEDEYKGRGSNEFSLQAAFHSCYTMSKVIPSSYLSDRLTFVSSKKFFSKVTQIHKSDTAFYGLRKTVRTPCLLLLHGSVLTRLKLFPPPPALGIIIYAHLLYALQRKITSPSTQTFNNGGFHNSLPKILIKLRTKISFSSLREHESYTEHFYRFLKVSEPT
jgi:hypothetical protein